MRASALDHVQPVLEALRLAGLNTYLSEAGEGSEPPFVVVHPDPGVGIGGPISDPSTHVRIDFQLTCVGKTGEQALSVSDRAIGVVNRFQPSVSGRDVWPIWAEERPQPVRRDDSTHPNFFYATSRWSIYSQPA